MADLLPSVGRRGRAFSVKTLPGATTVALVCFLLLYAPIFTLVAFSFNAGESIALWQGFSWRWYFAAWENVAVQEAAFRSFVIAAFASAISTVLATMAALGTTRNAGLGDLVAAHAAFCVRFAYLPIRARLEGMDPTLELAAADLYASEWQTLRRVTLPLLMPGIIAGAMLSFVISLDDVVITEFVKSAGQDTLPTYMLGQLRRMISPEVNAISTSLLAITVVMLTAFYPLSRMRKP